MKSVIFLGPSLPLEVAQELLPGGVFLPPAQQADLLSAVETYLPDVIGLIDGSFGETLSVWHKEILFALHRGVRVLGAASMGALRAAELESFGMQGVGAVFRLFRTGELLDDDEVALLHTGADDGFRALSEPMVNVRATVQHARDAGILDAPIAQKLIDTAKRLHFSRRTLSNILVEADLSSSDAGAAREVFRTQYVDLKATDARLLLECVHEMLIQDSPQTRPMVRSRGFERLYNNERTVRHSGTEISLRSIAAHAALNAPDFDDLNFSALNRALLLVLAEMLHVEPTEAEIEAETLRFRRKLRLTDQNVLDEWLRANDLTTTALRALIRELATSRRLHRWILGGAQAQPTRWLLDELRLRGRYADTAKEVAEECICRSDVESVAELDEGVLMDLVPAHLRATGWRLNAPIADWALEAGFTDLKDLAYELLRARRIRERRRGQVHATTSTESSHGRTGNARLYI